MIDSSSVNFSTYTEDDEWMVDVRMNISATFETKEDADRWLTSTKSHSDVFLSNTRVSQSGDRYDNGTITNVFNTTGPGTNTAEYFGGEPKTIENQ